MLRMAFFYSALAGVSVFALWRGGGPERTVAVLFIIASLATLFVQSAPPVRFNDVEIGVFCVDAALLAGLLLVAIRAERYWPLWMTALQGVAVAAHGARAVNPHVIPWAYAALLAFWGYPMVALLGIATWRHRVRLKRFGTERSWTPSSLRSEEPRPDIGVSG